MSGQGDEVGSSYVGNSLPTIGISYVGKSLFLYEKTQMQHSVNISSIWVTGTREFIRLLGMFCVFQEFHNKSSKHRREVEHQGLLTSKKSSLT